MRLELTGRQVTITPAIRKAVERRLARMGRMLQDHIVSVQVVIGRLKSRHHVEMTLHARGDHFFHGSATGRDLTAALGAAAEKIEHQVQKLKSKWTERKRQGMSTARAALPKSEQERAPVGSARGPRSPATARCGSSGRAAMPSSRCRWTKRRWRSARTRARLSCLETR